MGTNFYGIKKSSEMKEKIERIEAELRSLNISTELEDLISDYFGMKSEQSPRIHIGKSSGGWKFHFNHNNWKYFTDRKTLIEWLNTVEIVSEWGEVFSTEDFMEGVDREKDCDYAVAYKFKNPFFYIEKDGLEFSISTNFS